jgi:MFS family permease
MIWQENNTIPRGAAAVLSALRLPKGSKEPLDALTDEDWRQALAFSDRAQLTLLLGQFDAAGFPDWVRDRLERNLSDNCRHTERMRAAYFEIAGALEESAVEFVALKGFAQAQHYVPDLRFRVQYDIDLFCPHQHLSVARRALERLGYVASEGFEKFPLDHLPSMVRWDGWRPTGNYFDPDMAVAVDVHFRFWDAETERFDAPGAERFWARRTVRDCDGRDVPVLDPSDALAYATLHTLRHWLRGSLKAFHVYELAYFLDRRLGDEAFWAAWREAHPPRLRELQAICFRLAREWFGCRLPDAVGEEIERLPRSIQAWFERSAASPIEALFQPKKDELWLHMSLIESVPDQLSVIRRRLFPARLPGPVEGANPPDGPLLRTRVQRAAKYVAHVATRTAFHVRAAAPTLWRGLACRLPFESLGGRFWTFLGAAGLFNFGLFVFFILYNLRLLELGYKENVLGWVTSAMTAGSIAGTLPAGVLIRRLQLRRALLVCLGGFAAVSTLRSMVTGETALLVCAFLTGLFYALWAVSIPPAVAQLTTERTRPIGFSAVFATGIGMGVVGGIAGGRLPALLGSKRAALLAGCVSMALAMLPAARLRFTAGPAGRRGVTYPRSGFIVRFLAALAVWGFAVGTFNSFFSAYFATHLRAATDWIGAVFSASQLAQVAAVLLSPLVLRKFGTVRGIMGMQIATGFALAALARGPTGWAAASAYAAYTSFQYMSEPGIFSLLTSGVRTEEQGGASALNFLVTFSVQAIAVACAGSAYARFGYPPVLGAAACLAIIAALLFGLLLGRFAK